LVGEKWLFGDKIDYAAGSTLRGENCIGTFHHLNTIDNGGLLVGPVQLKKAIQRYPEGLEAADKHHIFGIVIIGIDTGQILNGIMHASRPDVVHELISQNGDTLCRVHQIHPNPGT